jgi:hypothetical protein
MVSLTIFVVAVCLFAGGCASGPPPVTRGAVVPWTIKLAKVTPASVEVDLIGVSKSENDYWKSINLDEYWKPNSPIRQQAAGRAKTTRFETSNAFALDAKDPIWKTWFGYGSYEVVVLANLPGKFAGGANDPRRLFLLLGKKEWNPQTKRTLDLEVLESQVRVLTPQEP